MTKEEMLESWRSRKKNVPTQDGFIGFFQSFRPRGEGLVEELEGLEGASEILPRLLTAYEVTSAGWDEGDAYFVVKNPKALEREKAARLAKMHLRKFADIAKVVKADDLSGMLNPLPTIEVIEGQTPLTPRTNDVEILLYEARTDFMGSLSPLPSDALLLGEALYYLACDYFLRDYILWPIYRQSTIVIEPFESYFELWKFGVSIRFVNDGFVRVFVPKLID